jgi:AcrR family transcriptional regulator
LLTKEQIRVEEIVENASVAFAKYGYKKTSLEDIAKLTGLTKTALYYYFKNKEELFKAVVFKEAQSLSMKIVNIVSTANNPVEQLKLYIQARMLGLQDVSIIYDIFKSELYDHLNFINEVRATFIQEEKHLIKTILDKGIEENVFAIENTECTSETIILLLKGLEIPLFIESDISVQAKKLEQVTTLLLKGILN